MTQYTQAQYTHYEQIDGKWVKPYLLAILKAYKAKDIKTFVELVIEYSSHHLREDLNRDQNVSEAEKTAIMEMFELNQFLTVTVLCDGRDGWSTAVNPKSSDKSVTDYFMTIDGVTEVKIHRPEIYKEFA